MPEKRNASNPARRNKKRRGVPGRVAQDYLKAIYRLREHGDRVTTKRLAELMKVSPPTVTQTLKRLSEEAYIKYIKYRGVFLTEAGEKIALEMIRHHRLVEQFLHKVLGLSWDRVHDEAERWEHILSEEVEARIAQMLDHPTHDPHGAPIPSQNLVITREPLTPLAQLETGATGVVAQVSDHDPALLRHLDQLGIVPGSPVTIRARDPFGGSLSVSVNGIHRLISIYAASHIHIRR